MKPELVLGSTNPTSLLFRSFFFTVVSSYLELQLHVHSVKMYEGNCSSKSPFPLVESTVILQICSSVRTFSYWTITVMCLDDHLHNKLTCKSVYILVLLTWVINTLVTYCKDLQRCILSMWCYLKSLYLGQLCLELLKTHIKLGPSRKRVFVIRQWKKNQTITQLIHSTVLKM